MEKEGEPGIELKNKRKGPHIFVGFLTSEKAFKSRPGEKEANSQAKRWEDLMTRGEKGGQEPD